MPTPRADFAIAAYQGKIYCIGGYMCDYVLDLERTISVTCNVVEVYDTVTNSWSVKAVIPFDGSGIVGHVVDGKIFVRDRHMLYLYDPDADVWTEKTSMSTFTPLSCASTVVDGKIIACAEYMDVPYNTELRVLIYDPKTDVWHDGIWPPFEVVGMDAAVATIGIYAPKNVYFLGIHNSVVGGVSTLENTKVYDPLKNIWWSTNKTIPTSRTNFGVAVVDDAIYVIGGTFVGPEGPYYTEGTWRASAVNEQYVPIGYSSIPLTSDFASKNYSTYTIAVVLVLTVGFVGGLFLFKKAKKEKHLLI
jgi:N-acetylneuraminic acid mutarotase